MLRARCNRGLAVALGVLLGSAASLDAAGLDARYSVDAWGTEQGLLPQSSVLAMVQTRDGYLWLGTLNGLVRFDGLHFTVFDESNTPKLESVRIVRLLEDSRSNLWVGTETAGAALIQNGRVHPLNIGRGSRAGHLVSICEDSTGAVWLLTEDAQLARYANENVDVWNLGREPGQSVIAEKDGMIWIGTGRPNFRRGRGCGALEGAAADHQRPARSPGGFAAGQRLGRLLAPGRRPDPQVFRHQCRSRFCAVSVDADATGRRQGRVRGHGRQSHCGHGRPLRRRRVLV